MTDEDLLLLYREELRLFNVYTLALSEESRYPQRVEKKRRAWLALYDKLRPLLPPEKRRELLQAHVAETGKDVKR